MTADVGEVLVPGTPFDGSVAAGKCVLTPELEIVDCRNGHADESWAWDAILDHAGG